MTNGKYAPCCNSRARRISVVCALTTALLVGCQTAPVDRSAVESGDYGPYPDNYKEIIQAHWRPILKDPYSAQYHYAGGPFKCYMRDAPVAGGKPVIFGYCVMFSMNAKNSYGAYIGETQYRFFIKNGRTKEFSKNTWFDEFWYR